MSLWPRGERPRPDSTHLDPARTASTTLAPAVCLGQGHKKHRVERVTLLRMIRLTSTFPVSVFMCSSSSSPNSDVYLNAPALHSVPRPSSRTIMTVAVCLATAQRGEECDESEVCASLPYLGPACPQVLTTVACPSLLDFPSIARDISDCLARLLSENYIKTSGKKKWITWSKGRNLLRKERLLCRA